MSSIFSRIVIVTLVVFTARTALTQTQNAAPQQQAAQELDAKRKGCPTTRAPQPLFTPKGSDARLKQSDSQFFFGTPKLSVLLTQNWTVHQQVRWFSDDAHATPFNMTITGRRLDPDVSYAASSNANPQDSAPKFSQAPGRTDGNLILSTVDFRTPGCWEITARLNDTELRFVTYVRDGK